MIGIIIAMKDEIASLKKLNKNISTFDTGFFKYYLFNDKKEEYVIGFSGVGKSNASACTIDMIKTFTVKKIINIGTCGSCDPKCSIFDIIIVKNNYYIDVDVTSFGYEYGQLPGEKPFFNNENKFNEKIKECLKNNNFSFMELNSGTADIFIDLNTFKKIDKKIFSKISCIDMESAAIAHIASKKKVDCCFIKIISDSLFNKNKSTLEFDKNLKKIANLNLEIISKITSLFGKNN